MFEYFGLAYRDSDYIAVIAISGGSRNFDRGVRLAHTQRTAEGGAQSRVASLRILDMSQRRLTK